MVNDYFFDVIFVLDCILSRVVCGRNSSNDSVTFFVRIGAADQELYELYCEFGINLDEMVC
jgi:hypothetical protein